MFNPILSGVLRSLTKWYERNRAVLGMVASDAWWVVRYLATLVVAPEFILVWLYLRIVPDDCVQGATTCSQWITAASALVLIAVILIVCGTAIWFIARRFDKKRMPKWESRHNPGKEGLCHQ
jgi:hypothetical protein